MFIQDLRYAFRGLARRPGFTAIAVITLSLGIGATTAIFSVVQAVLLRPLEFDGADRLVKVVGFDKADGITGNLSPADFLDFERDNTTMTSMGANGFVGLATISGGRGEAGACRLRPGDVRILLHAAGAAGARPLDSRRTTIDPAPRASSLLSHGFWRRRFGGDPSIVGRVDHVERGAGHGDRRAAGELPPPRDQSRAAAPTLHAVPLRSRRNPTAAAISFAASARLKDGVTVEQARAEIEAIAARLEQQYPTDNTDQGVRLTPLLDSMVSESRPVLLLLARRRRSSCCWWRARTWRTCCSRAAPAGLRELALRAAIGADRGRLVRQMLTESAALSLLGAAGGLLLAFWATRALTVLAATGIPRADQIGIERHRAGVRGRCRDVDERGVRPAAGAAPVEARPQRRAEGRRPPAGRRRSAAARASC